MREALNHSPRVELTPATTPPPVWAGLKFTCANCTAEFQLEAADDCKPIDGTIAAYLTPRCWNCGQAAVIEIPQPLGGS